MHGAGRAFETFGELSRRAETERKNAEAERRRADALLARLRAAGIDPGELAG